MISFGIDPQVPAKILCLGAHSDDIEIGAGGTILRLLAEHRNLSICWVVFSSTPVRAVEARTSAAKFLAGAAEQEVVVKAWRDGFLPYVGAEVKEYFEELKLAFQPDLIFTHYRHDLHQDHRLICDLTWNTWRNHQILEYEIPKYEGDLGTPNLFMHLDAATCRRKTQILLDSFPSQATKPWFTADTFSSLMRIRGLESHAPEAYAEAFHCRKLVVRRNEDYQ